MSSADFNRGSNLKEEIAKLYQSKKFSDVTFTVGSQVFKAHKLIVSSRCSELSRILLEDPNAVDNVIPEGPITETGFEIFLRFIYTDTLGTNEKQSIVQAYVTADHYKQKKLMKKCEDIMRSWSITEDEVCELLNVSLDIPRLRELCLNFIKNNARRVISNPNFFELSYAAMNSILDFDALKDIDLPNHISSIIDWARRKLEDTDDYEAIRNFLLENEPSLLGKLKIEELQLSEIGQLFTVRYQNFLTPIEITNFIQHCQTKNKKALPEWCATK